MEAQFFIISESPLVDLKLSTIAREYSVEIIDVLYPDLMSAPATGRVCSDMSLKVCGETADVERLMKAAVNLETTL